MSFLSPLFFLGLSAIAIPVLVHLIQRERKRVILFPSLMFVQRIPYQSVRRRRIRHWLLLLMRAAAIVFVVLAFSRPFLPQRAAAAVAAGGNREVVVLLDRSASMGYTDHWQKAKDAARGVFSSLGANDRATLVLFDRNAEENLRATSDRGRLEAALDAAQAGSGATRYGPALKLAESILSRSALARREAVLISDFQKSGWADAEDVHFPDNMTLTPIVIGDGSSGNVSVPSVTFSRSTFSGQERVTVTAGVTNRNDKATTVPVTLDIGGQQIETQTVTIAANASSSVTFAPFTLTDPQARGIVRAGSDSFPADNAFYFVVTPSTAMSVLVVNSESSRDPSFFLTRALSIGNTPLFRVDVEPAGRVNASMLDKVTAVVLNDTVTPAAFGSGVLKRYVERGGGLLVVLGEHSLWPSGDADLLPGRIGAPMDREGSRGGTIGYLDYSHPVFEVFKAPRSGDFAAPRVLRYRVLEAAPAARILARYDDGAVAAAERRVGAGRVIVWTTSLDDSWSDLALKPVFLPLVHQLIKYVGHYEQSAAWSTVGQVIDLSASLKSVGSRIVVTPSGDRRTVPANDPGLLELNEQGFYEVRSGSGPGARSDRIATNIDPAESDLSPLDARELVASVTGHATPGSQPTAAAELTREEAEKRQSVWWYLLLVGLALLVAESAIANRLSRHERFS